MKRRYTKVLTAVVAASMVFSSVSMMTFADDEINSGDEASTSTSEPIEVDGQIATPEVTSEVTPTPTAEPEAEPEAQPLTGVEGFVQRLYLNTLGRDAEPAGLAYWADEINGGKPAVEVVQFFFEGEEFTNKQMNDSEYVEVLYNTLFGREADQAGLDYWTEQIAQGATRRFVLSGFANSDEFQNLCTSYGVTKGEFSLTEATDIRPELNSFVALAYSGVLGRLPDQAGLSYWVNQVASGTTASEMLTGFFYSDEVANKNLTNEEFVTLCYRAFLLREPDEAGLQAWASLFDQGLSKRYIMSRIAESQEFKNLCDSYNVVKGSINLFEYRDMYPEYTKFINNAYTKLVGTAPSAETLNNYLGSIRKGTKTLRQTIKDIAELGSSRPSSEWIPALYDAALGRGCSQAELNSQLDTLESSGKKTVIEALVDSGEFDTRCSNLGLITDSTNRLERGANGAIYGYSMENALLTGWNYVDGLKYFFYEDGTMCQDVRGILEDQESYHLTINTVNNIIMVYAWDDVLDDWAIPVVAFVCSCGQDATPTILGDYTLHSQSRWGLMMGDVYCQYLTRISGNYLIHSECYSTVDNYTMNAYGYSLLGQRASHGCVRVTCADAKWVYTHCNNSSVHIYADGSVKAPFDKPVPPPAVILPNGRAYDPTDPEC
ncbi:MAG: DUF4214 domain-containing protein [Clostridia bacterium]|nr:DUF4214 domain-containing protein [Clostridia bacterium]